MRTLILFLLLSTQTIAADVYVRLRNESGKDLRVKIGNNYHNLNINKTIEAKLSNVFKTDVQAIYQNRTVASTQVPTGRNVKLRLYIKDNLFFLDIDKR